MLIKRRADRARRRPGSLRARRDRRSNPVHHAVYAGGASRAAPQAKLRGLVLASVRMPRQPSAAALREDRAQRTDRRRRRASRERAPAGARLDSCRCRPTRSRSSTASRSRPSSARSWTSPRSCDPTRCVTRSRRPRSRPVPLGVLGELVAAADGRRGVRALRAILDERSVGNRITKSHLERACLAFLRRHGLPLPQTNTRSRATRSTACGAAPGSSWSSTAELHSNHGKFERDRARDRALTIAGWRVAA